MNDVANGDSRRNGKLGCPDVELKVGDGHYPRTKALGVVLNKPTENQRSHKHHGKLLQYDEEHCPETGAHTAL